jgi:plasmid maintenance system antidote protein VapI
VQESLIVSGRAQGQVPANRIKQILHGGRDITADAALPVAHLGTSAEFWVHLQSLHDLRTT